MDLTNLERRYQYAPTTLDEESISCEQCGKTFADVKVEKVKARLSNTDLNKISTIKWLSVKFGGSTMNFFLCSLCYLQIRLDQSFDNEHHRFNF